MKNIKTKKKYLYHLGNFNSPLLDKPPPWAGPRVKYCLRCSFWLLAVFRHFSLPLFVLVSLSLEISIPKVLCNSIAICCL